MTTLQPPPVPSASSSTDRPSLAPRSSSYRSPALPSVGLSNLTTRSSSTSRAYDPDQQLPTPNSPYRAAVPPGAFNVGGAAYRAWRRDSKEHSLLLARRRSSAGVERVEKENRTAAPRERKASKGKGKAVAFVVGLPSSGEEGDVEPDEGPEAGEAREDGLEGVFNLFDKRWEGAIPREPNVDDMIRCQIRKSAETVDSLDLDSLLPNGVADYTFVTYPSNSSSDSLDPLQTPKQPSTEQGSASKRIVLGKGKFSEVILVRKGDTEYALKHTPLHPHHPLIASRLLREPAILAQLLPHRNLVKVFETIRTPGHFYLVEENLRSSVTLEALVSSSPGGVLPVEQAWSILDQLASVVRSLHEPLRVCHRDIKPENVLIRVSQSSPTTPPTLLLKLLDFGLATHYSASEPKLTTCCGSPAYHSPELWKSLRTRNSPVKYWGPEIDIWCTGLTLLRCLAPNKYPLGVSHASLASLSDKVVDALLGIRDPSMRQVLAGFLHMDGKKRMRSFDRFCAGLEQRAKDKAEREGKPLKADTLDEEPRPREFKTTSFLPTAVEHRLQLYLDESSCARSEGPQLEATAVVPLEADAEWSESLVRTGARRTGRSTSTSRTATLDSPKLSPTTVVATGLPRAASESPESPLPYEAPTRRPSVAESISTSTPDLSPYPSALGLYPSSSDSLSSPYSLLSPSAESLSFGHPTNPPPIQLTLLNPTDEPIRRAISYIKYALRCSGILYHVHSTNSPTRHGSLASFASPWSAPPSLPPTPYIQPFPTLPLQSPSSFPFPLAQDDEDDFVCYLECVTHLPPANTGAGTASSALLAALASEGASQRDRPGMATRTQVLARAGAQPRSVSTPPEATASGGRKDQKKKDLVEALPFFLSIRKSAPFSATTPPFVSSPSIGSSSSLSSPTSPSSAASGTRRRRTSTSPRSTISPSSRIIITLSDDRALPFVREALTIVDDPASGSGESSEDTSAERQRRGRSRYGGSGPRADNSGSRDARARRNDRAAKQQREHDDEKKRRSRSIDVRSQPASRATSRAASRFRGGEGGERMASSSRSRGLGMEMGPEAKAEQRRERTTSTLWEMAGGLMNRITGGGGGGAKDADESSL